MIVGYARTSTIDQVAGLEAQVRELEAAGGEKVFREHVSSVAIEREELARALEFVREGDTLVVTKLDRLARSLPDLLGIVTKLDRKHVTLRTVAADIDTGTPTGKLLLGILGSIAQFEREIMLERQREGIAKAKAEGAYKGRKPTARAKSDEVRRLASTEGRTRQAIARELGVSERSVYRILASIEECAQKPRSSAPQAR